ncbi:hypothetical protein N7509_004111 [Penicillium cosmopolitanum]|uniref:Uncharacterized protein n=1 Tax=Penicillium cosmopolitanum TaxID=1131564 RepID=A0A9W9W6B1_9EURO|nr:uncharacterized protein N7509_004111 [Penicillium cosmopolitanum]KAJ5404240.1 hypothetical protein N7509_004111 [Penicillium cosmopolitanum]
MHHQPNKVPQKVTLEMLAKIGVIADYYKCKDILHLPKGDDWIRSLDEQYPPACLRDLTLWLWISWAFQIPDKFKAITGFIMSNSISLIMDTGELPIPPKIIAAMNESREAASKRHCFKSSKPARST